MLLHFFILNFFFFSVISSQSNISPLNVNEFRNNLIDLVDHFRLQNGWKYLQHIQLRMDRQIVNVNQIFFSDINEFNVIPKFKQITLVFNYRYCEILKSFNDAIKMFVTICEDKQSNQQSTDEYVDCVKQLKRNLVDSIDMYERLYEAICFMSNIYLYLTKDNPTILQPKIVGDALLQIKQFIKFKSKSNLDTNEKMDTVVREFISIKLFFEKTTILLLENFIQKNHSFYHIKKSTVNIFDNYELQLPINCLDGKRDYVRDMGNILKDFYHYTIKKYYDNFGFNKIIHLEILGQSRPIEINSQPKNIPALDMIIKQSGWNLLHYINILTNNNKLLYINNIITGQVNPSNFSTKAFNLNKLLKCRYTEILNHYTVLINNIIFQCNDKNKDNYRKNFVHCVLQLYHSVNESKNMLDYMLSALKSMRTILNYKFKYAYELRLENIIKVYKNFIEKMDRKYNSINIFVDKNGNGNEDVANMFLNELKRLHDDIIKPNINKLIGNEMKYCVPHKMFDEKNRNEYIESIKETMKNENLSDFYIAMSNNLILFCQKVILEDYKNLGFNLI